jgi:hypothetical protein
MTGRERVKASLTFSNPDRIPRDLWALPAIALFALPAIALFRKKELDDILRRFPTDVEGSQISPGSSEVTLKNTATVGSYRDDWGSVWHVGEPGVVGEVKEPALSSWDELKRFQPPWNTLKSKNMDYVNANCEGSQKFMLSEVTARPFERLQFLRGSENLYLDLGYNSKNLRKLVEIVHDFYIQEITLWCKSNVDAIFLMDDWGSKSSLLISPEMWRELFKPLYRNYCDLIHSYNKFVFFHSDGFIEPIFGDFIELGVDAINSQLFTMNIESLGEKYAGRITFWGEIDRQHVLPFASKGQVREAVRRVSSALQDETGGVIGQCEWGKNVSAENIAAVFEAWNETM